MTVTSETTIPIERVPVDELPTWLTRRDLERHLRIGRSRAYAILKAHGRKVGRDWRLPSAKIREIVRTA